MKTALEWRKLPVFTTSQWTTETIDRHIQAIQLDAAKSAMRIAGEHVKQFDFAESKVIGDELIAVADNVTIGDL